MRARTVIKGRHAQVERERRFGGKALDGTDLTGQLPTAGWAETRNRAQSTRRLAAFGESAMRVRLGMLHK